MQLSQRQSTENKKNISHLNLSTVPHINSNLADTLQSLSSSIPTRGNEENSTNFDSYGLSMEEINVLYSPTCEFTPAEFNLQLQTNDGNYLNAGNIFAPPPSAFSLPSINDSLSGYLNDGDRDEPNPAISAGLGETVGSVGQSLDSDKKAKRKYTKKPKKNSVFSFEGFDSGVPPEGSPSGSSASSMSPLESNKSTQSATFFPEALGTTISYMNSSSSRSYDPNESISRPASAGNERMHAHQNAGDGGHSPNYSNPIYAISSPNGYSYRGSNNANDSEIAAALPSLLSLGNQGHSYFPNSQYTNYSPMRNDFYQDQLNYAQNSSIYHEMIPNGRYFTVGNLGKPGYPVTFDNFTYNHHNGSPNPQHQSSDSSLGANGSPHLVVPQGYQINKMGAHYGHMFMATPVLGMTADGNLSARNTSFSPNPSGSSNDNNGRGIRNEEYLNSTSMEMLIQMDSSEAEQQRHLIEQQHNFQAMQRGHLMQFNNQQISSLQAVYASPSMMPMSQMNIGSAPLSAKRRPKAANTSGAKGKAAKGGASGVKIKAEDTFDENDDMDDTFAADISAKLGQMSDHSHNSHGHSSSIAEAAAAMVTGNSIKGTSRANNSLSSLSKRFVEHYGDSKTIPYISGQLDENDVSESPPNSCRVDGAAETMAVHVRRIYELIKILEILSLIVFTGGKRGKFTWKGTKDFLFCLGCLQAEAIAKFPESALNCGLMSVTALDSTESFEKLLPSINNLHINVMNAHTTAYTADLLLQMKTNSPTNTSALDLMNQLNQKECTSASDNPHQQREKDLSNLTGKEEMVVSSNDQERDSGSEDDDCTMSTESHTRGKLASQPFAMLPPLPPHNREQAEGLDRAATLKPSRTDGKRSDGLVGEGLVSSGKVSFEGGKISIPSHSDSEGTAGGPNSMTPVVKISEDGSSTKKRSKEATPRKMSKTKQPGQPVEPEPAPQQPLKLDSKIITGIAQTGKSPPTNYGSSNDHEHFMMETICRNFLQLFLVGMNSFTMSYAVHTLIPMAENESVEEYNKKNATKIRRVYDIANVLCSLNIVQKKHIPRPVETDTSGTGKKKELKSDLKVMLWSSYSPLVIRRHFVNKSRDY